MTSSEINLLIQSALSLVELVYRLKQSGEVPEEALLELKELNHQLNELETLSSWSRRRD